MNLLPKSHKEFSSAEYWETFFKKRGSKEWYGEYGQLCGVLHKYIKPTDKVLMIGCSNSQLSADLYDVGYRAITNIDISEVVIKQMKEKNKESRSDMLFMKMDMLQMTFDDDAFNVVLDKGTLDALMTDSSDEIQEKVDRMFAEIGRVLKLGGRYVCISLCQEQVLRKAVTYFSQEGWMIRIHRINKEDEEVEGDFSLPVFAFVFTKFKKIPNFKPILELSLTEERTERMDDGESLVSAILNIQQFAVIRHKVNKSSSLEEQLCLELHSPGIKSPRFTIHIVDGKIQRKSEQKYAVFIVPEGRENEWLFSSEEGRRQLSESANFERLAVVSLHCDHSYTNLEAIQKELSSRVMELSPPGMSSNIQVPFLSIGQDIGNRTVRYRGNSAISGDFVVEDVEGDGDGCYRNLVFLSNRNSVQSQAKLLPDTKKGKKKNSGAMKIDTVSLLFDIHQVMVAGLALMDDFQQLIESEVKVVLIGLGGGILSSHIHHCFKMVTMDVVELDPEVVTIATNWFGAQEDKRLRIHVDDGLKYINNMAERGEKCHVLMIDVNSTDTSVGLSGPPRSFVEEEFLKTIETCLHPNGILVMNLVARNKTVRDEVLATLNKVFKYVLVQDLRRDVNQAVFAMPYTRRTEFTMIDRGIPTSVKSALQVLNKYVKAESDKDSFQEMIYRLSCATLL